MKPRICEILEVEVNENFKFMGNEYWIGQTGIIHEQNNDDIANPYRICDMINESESIIRKPRVTDEEKEILRAAVLLFDLREIKRDYEGRIIGGTLTSWYRLEKADRLFSYIKTDSKAWVISDLLGE